MNKAPARAASRRASLAAFAVLLASAPLLGACSASRPDVPRAPGMADARWMAGTWHVLESNFPLWLDGSKTDPAFHYRLLADPDGLRLDDVVSYREDGAPDTIEGVDAQDPADPTHFTWRGKGILCLFTSDWYVVLRARDDSWAVIYFSSTLATPEGVDIIARKQSLPPEVLSQVRAAIAAHPGLRAKAAGMRPVRRSSDAR